MSDAGEESGNNQAAQEDASRQAFYKQFFESSPGRPEIDFPRICTSWLDASGASWVWLWLFNPYIDEWEIRHVGASNGMPDDFVLPSLTAPKEHSVAEYCSQRGEPLIKAPLDWSESHNGSLYSVSSRSFLKEKKCENFDCIPFSEPIPEKPLTYRGKPGLSRIIGAICLHYERDSVRKNHPITSLKLMASLTSLAVVNSFQAIQFEILVKLNFLAEKYLTRVSRKPVEIRRQYLDGVIGEIREHLKVAAVSIFYHDTFNRQIQCLATTGLCTNDYKNVPQDQIENVIYRIGVGRTGKCFKDGVVDVFTSSDAQSHRWIYSEMAAGKQVGMTGAVICPIPLPEDSRGGNPDEPKSHGVIRCADRVIQFHPECPRPFDPVTVQTLEFIARQIGPVLETLNVRVARERTISIIKHDLYAPLTMIRHTADEIASDIRSGRTVAKYSLMNLQTAALLADASVGELDPDPGSEGKLDMDFTLLEGDIFGRISNMLSFLAEQDNEMKIEFFGFHSIHGLYIDRRAIERVFVNLLVNAIKYGTSGSTITVYAYASEHRKEYRVDVRNSGIGVGEDDALHIFEPDYRAEEARDLQQGAGLGLYIAKELMKAHGGDLVLSSGKPELTEFTVIFPMSLRFQGAVK